MDQGVRNILEAKWIYIQSHGEEESYMRQISAMYEWSGGTDYHHTCYECNRCKRLNDKKRHVFRCLNYDSEYNWNAANIACKFFGIIKEKPLVEIINKNKTVNDEFEGQMSIFDFM